MSERNLSGLLLIFIGLIISMFVGFGFILTLIGACMVSGVNEDFKKSRNSFIGSLVVSIVSVFIAAGLSWIFVVIFSAANAPSVGAWIGFVIALVAIIIALYFFNLRAFRHLMYGCSDVATRENDTELAEACERTYSHYGRSILLATIAAVALCCLFWVPVLNVFLFVFVIGAGIYYIVAQIMIIVRVWQTYNRFN